MAITDFSEFVQNNLEEIHNSSVHKSFLGLEFLTWLWFYVESEGGLIEFKSDELGKVKGTLRVNDRIVLTAKSGLSHDHTIKGGNPSQCQEAAIALRHGKSVKELRLSLEIENIGAYGFSLSGNDLSPKSVHLPDLRDDTDESSLEQRIRSTSVLGGALDFLMAKFMNDRASKVWDTEKLESIRTWIKTRAQGRDGVIH